MSNERAAGQPPAPALTIEELSRFRAAMDMSGDAIYLVDRATMRFVDVNRTACTRMGYSREELLRMGPQDLLTSSREEIERLYDQVIAAGDGATFVESRARTRDGRETITELQRRALRTEDGWVIVSIARDITERRRTEQALLESEQRFRLTFELAGSGMAHVDLAGRFLRVNRSLCKILGYAEAELVGRTVKEFSHPEDFNSTDAPRARMRTGEVESIRAHKRYLRKDGATVWVDLTVALVRDAGGAPLYEVAVFDDDTERKQAEQALRDVAEELRVFADNVPAMTAVWDADLRCRFVNRHYAEFFDSTVEGVLGRHLRDILADGFDDVEQFYAQALQGHPATYQRVRRTRNGDARHLEVRLVPHTDEQGRILGCFSVATDITDHKLTEERIQRVAHHDGLTGLPNKLLFNDRLRQAITLARRDARQFALLYLDLDRFKPVNDALGHAAGDEVLVRVAERIRRQLRESDTVARVGGDEFTVILTDVARREDAQAIATKISAALRAPFRLEQQARAIEIGCSIGIAIFPTDARDAEALVAFADADMYRAKQAPR